MFPPARQRAGGNILSARCGDKVDSHFRQRLALIFLQEVATVLDGGVRLPLATGNQFADHRRAAV